MLAERVDIKAIALRTVGRGNRLLLEVDHQAKARERRAVIEQRIDLGLGQHHGEQAVLVAVTEEDVGERRRNHAAKPVIDQRPGRVLARGPAAEILARQEDLRTLVARLVEDEIRVERAARVVHPGLAVVEVAPRIEQVGSEAGALDRLEELLRNDRVGVDVRPVQRRNQSFEAGEFLHLFSFLCR